jgi:hypothetical protein
MKRPNRLGTPLIDEEGRPLQHRLDGLEAIADISADDEDFPDRPSAPVDADCLRGLAMHDECLPIRL